MHHRLSGAFKQRNDQRFAFQQERKNRRKPADAIAKEKGKQP
jgi:hypothetical protein